MRVVRADDFALESVQFSRKLRNRRFGRDITVRSCFELTTFDDVGSDQSAQTRRFLDERAADPMLLKEERGC